MRQAECCPRCRTLESNNDRKLNKKVTSSRAEVFSDAILQGCPAPSHAVRRCTTTFRIEPPSRLKVASISHAAASAWERASLARPRPGLATSRAAYISRVFHLRPSSGGRVGHTECKYGRDHGRPRLRLRSRRHRRRLRRPGAFLSRSHACFSSLPSQPSSYFSKTRVPKRSI